MKTVKWGLVAAATAALLVGGVAPSANAASTISISKPAMRFGLLKAGGVQVNVVTNITCTTRTPVGSVYAWGNLRQAQKGVVVSGSGDRSEVTIKCDGRAHQFSLGVFADSKVFRAGQASAYYDITICNRDDCQEVNARKVITVR